VLTAKDNGMLANSARFPEYNEELAKADEIEIPVQINGKLRDKLVMPADADETDLENAALNSEKIISDLTGLTVRKEIVVPGKLVNIVAN